MYQPRISDENIHKLYLLRLEKKIPMTKVIDEILDNYFKSLPENIKIEETKKTLKEFNLCGTGL